MSSIASNIDTQAITIDERHFARLCAHAASTHLRRITHTAASTTVLWVSTQVDAGAFTEDLSVRTNDFAFTILTGRIRRTDESTPTAVERISFEIDASTLTLRKRERTTAAHTAPHRTDGSGRTYNIASTAVERVVHGVDAALITPKAITRTNVDDAGIPRIDRRIERTPITRHGSVCP